MSRSTVSVVVPTWRRPEPLRRNLEALLRQTLPPDEVVVILRAVDEAAIGVVRDVAATAPIPVRFAEVDRPGHIAPIQRARDVVTSELVAFLDDDVEAESDWLAVLTAPFENPMVVCVGGQVRDPDAYVHGGVPDDAGRIRWYGRVAANVSSLRTNGPIARDLVQESNWAWRVAALRSLDFDPVLDFDDASMYGMDLCWQARERGGIVMYDSGAVVDDHPAPRDPSLDRSDRAPRIFAYCRNLTYIMLKHTYGWKRLVFVAWWWGVGERGSYGVLKGAADLVRRGRSDTWPLIRASFRGRAAGRSAWREHQGR